MTSPDCDGRTSSLPHATSVPETTSARTTRRLITPRKLDALGGVSQHRGALDVEIAEVAFDAALRHPVEPRREPPVAIAEELHRRRHEDHPDDGGVDEDGGGEA